MSDFYGSDKDARERAKRLRKEARRRPVKDARGSNGYYQTRKASLGPVRYGDTGTTINH